MGWLERMWDLSMMLKKACLTLAALLCALFALSPIASAKLAPKPDGAVSKPEFSKAIIIDTRVYPEITGRIITEQREIAVLDGILTKVKALPTKTFKWSPIATASLEVSTNNKSENVYYAFSEHFDNLVERKPVKGRTLYYPTNGIPFKSVELMMDEPLAPTPRSDVQLFAVMNIWKSTPGNVAISKPMTLSRKFCEKPGNAAKIYELLKLLGKQQPLPERTGKYIPPEDAERDSIELYVDGPQGFMVFDLGRSYAAVVTSEHFGLTWETAYPNTSETFDEILRLINEPA